MNYPRNCFLILSLLITGNLLSTSYSQNIPDYKERSFALFSDTTVMSSLTNKPFEIQATEGSVDPDEYLVGPGDQIFISISGIEEIPLNLFINQEGVLFIPKVGGVDLKGLTLAQSKVKIKKSIDQYYKNVDVFISLTDFRKIKVSLLGDVKKPSTFVLPANSRLMDLVVNSEGLNKTSNFRNIEILHRDSTLQKYDLLAFLRLAKKENNPLLREGDAVIVDRVDKVYSIYGMIKYPGTYEYIDGETVAHLIEVAGGLTAKAREDSIEVVSFEHNGKTQESTFYTFDQLKNEGVILHYEDQVMVREFPDYFDPKFVVIQGYVKYPGYYKINRRRDYSL